MMILNEYDALRAGAGFSDFSHWAKLRFSGPDRKKILNGLLSNDIAGLKPSGSCSTCLLTPKGKLIAVFEIYDRGENLLALLEPAAAPGLQAALSRRIVLSETTMDDLGAGQGLFYLAGPKTFSVVAGALGARPDLKDSAAVLPYPRLASDGVLILFPAAQAEVLRDALAAAGATPVGEEALEVLRVERGVALFGKDMGAETIPQEARLEDAINFTKGCYMGQETVARVKNLGHINKILVGLKLGGDHVPAPGAAVLAPEEVGTVTSAVWSPRHDAVAALATVKMAASSPGTSLRVRAGDRIIPGEVIALERWA